MKNWKERIEQNVKNEKTKKKEFSKTRKMKKPKRKNSVKREKWKNFKKGVSKMLEEKGTHREEEIETKRINFYIQKK